MCRSVDALRRLVILLVLAAFVPALRASASGAKRHYDLSAGDAATTLRHYTEQSGEQVVYVVPRVEGVTTNAVNGEFTARQAIERMVANTVLVVVEDEGTGAFMVKRAPANPGSSTPPSESKKPMKTKNPIALVAAWIGLVLAPVHAAQPADAGPTGTIEGRVLNPRNGDYLEKARITIEGTTIEVLTGSDGHYRISSAPAGQVRLRAFYTGLAPHSELVSVSGGQVVRHDINLSPDQTISGPGDTVVRLSEFVVATSRQMDGAAIAINEQRFAPNQVNVVSAEEFGTIAEGSVGEFLKFMPGITIGFEDGDAISVSMNGAPSDYVPITVAGFSLASANSPRPGSDGASRNVHLGQTSMNSVARVEVAFTPTPETSGAALAGSINLVPRSAFERTKRSFDFSTYITMRDNERDLGKSPLPGGEMGHTVRPGFSFSYVAPVSKRFGFTVSGGRTSNFVSDFYIQNTWRGAGAATNGVAFPDTTPDRPYLTQFDFVDSMSVTTRTSFGATADFKLGANDRVSLSFQFAHSDAKTDNSRMVFFIDQVRPGDFTPTSTQGAPGAGRIQKQGPDFTSTGATYTPTLTYRHDGPIWHAEAGAAHSQATGNVKNGSETGQFWNAYGLRSGLTIAFDDIFYLRPRSIRVSDGVTGAPIDPYPLAGYPLTSANNNSRKAVDLKRSAFANIRRDFLGRVPLAMKAGVDIRQQMRDNRGENPTINFVGADGRASSPDDDAAVVLDEVISQRTPPFGFPKTGWLSTRKTWTLYQEHPSYFQFNEVTRHNTQVQLSKHAEEIVSSAYLRGDAAFFGRRLKLVGGLRAEQTNVKGEGRLIDPRLNFQKDASGRVLTAANGTPLLIAPAGSLAAVQLTTIDRGLKAEKEYLRWFPSLNGSYNVRDNLIARAGYYWSVGRPNFAQYAGSLTLPNIESPPAGNNLITVNNAGIKAWSARTTKVSLEYYFERVGLISIGAFRRDFENFFGATVFSSTPEFLALYGLAPETYGAYDVSTQYNLPGSVRMTGVDFNYKQALTFLPHWARGVQVFANGSALRATGEASQNFSGYVPRSGSWGVSFARPRYDLRVNWNYRGRNRGNLVTGRGIEAGTYNWGSKRMYIDVSGQVSLNRKFALFANLRNIGDASDDFEIAGPSTPAHAQFRSREIYGSLWTFGLKGTF